ncbi:unnamed protein product, partial [Gulo gulo]
GWGTKWGEWEQQWSLNAQATPRKSSPDGNQIFPSGNTVIREDGF